MDRSKGVKFLGIAFEVFVVVVLLYFGTLYASQLFSHPSEIFSSTIYKVVMILGILVLVFMISRIYLKKESL